MRTCSAIVGVVVRYLRESVVSAVAKVVPMVLSELLSQELAGTFRAQLFNQ